MKRNSFLFIIALSVLLISCKKDTVNNSSCPIPSSVIITTNSPVIEGWPLTFSTYDEFGLLYKWTGANDWTIDYDYYSTQAYHQGKLTTSFSDAGIYKVELKSGDGCVLFQGAATVEIIAAPLPTCNIPNNTSISNVIGVGDNSYSNIYFQGGGGIYTVQSTSGGQTITFNFNGDTVPKPGTYKTSGYFAIDETTVGVFITSGGYDFINTGQDIYVNKVGTKTQVAFCDCIFTNPLGSSQIKISARLTQP